MSSTLLNIGGVAACAGFLCVLRYLWRRSRLNASSVKGKVILITGASSGLGEACAHVFHRMGAKVILAARRIKELERVANDISSQNYPGTLSEPKTIVLDLEDLDSIPRVAAKALSLFGHIDILINNGGISFRGEAVKTALDVDVQVMKTNYFGQVALTKAILPRMIARQYGHIVGISSIQGKIAIPYRSPYSASKHAFQAFLDSVRAEVADQNIHVTTVCPGYIQTNISINAVTGDGSKYGGMDKTTAAGMKPEFVAEKVAEAVLLQQSEVVLAPLIHKLAILIRTLCPALFFKLMFSRACKQRKELRQEEKRN